MSDGLSQGDIVRVVNRWIGVSGGYLGDFSYQSHAYFYPEYCEIDDVDPYQIAGTTRIRFTTILSQQSPERQAKILRGVLAKYPVGSAAPHGSNALRTPENERWVRRLIERLESQGASILVALPSSSDVVERAVRDAETLLSTNGAVSALDRVHTALHGYLRVVLGEAGIETGRDASLTELFKCLTREHLAFQVDQYGDETQRILRQIASILETLNQLRNRASLAHPNEQLALEPEARLAIDAAHAALNYINRKLARTGS